MTSLTLCAALAGMADAACYADYKAKQDNPLRLHYGVLELTQAACSDPVLAGTEARRRVEAQGWTFLNLVSTFDETGLDTRKSSAGEFFLRF